MKLLKIFILLFCFASFFSCHIKPRGIIGEKKMEKILFEMHKTEGILQAQGDYYNSSINKKPYFDFILKKYKVTQAEFDSSLVWYTKHPQEFTNVYKVVVKNIDDLNDRVQKGEFHPNDSIKKFEEINIWNLRPVYILTKDSARTKINFEIKDNNLMVGDVYELSFKQRIAPSDSSKSPYVVIRVNYLNGKKDSAFVRSYNDSILRRFFLKIPAKDTLKIKSISGALLGTDTIKGKMNARVEEIKLIRRFNPYRQSFLKERVMKKDKSILAE